MNLSHIFLSITARAHNADGRKVFRRSLLVPNSHLVPTALAKDRRTPVAVAFLQARALLADYLSGHQLRLLASTLLVLALKTDSPLRHLNRRWGLQKRLQKNIFWPKKSAGAIDCINFKQRKLITLI